MTLEDLGYSDFFEDGRKRAGLDSFVAARVIAEHRESYRVISQTGEYAARITGKQMFEASSREEYPAVGDWVAITELNAEQAVIHGVIPRKTVLKRKEAGGPGVQVIAANIDTAFIVQAVGRDFSINRFERYAALIVAGGAQPAIILNKSDLASESELDAMVEEIKERLPGVDVTTVSTYTGNGIEGFAAQLEKGKTYCLVGSSGVGKSSLINTLIGDAVLMTKEISAGNKRGQHVTTARALFILPSGAMIIDNPGMRELGVLSAEAGIGKVFDEIVELARSCRFPDCTHLNELGCAVRAAIESGTLDEKQYESYAKLKKENEFSEMTDTERREKNRAFGKFIKKAKEQIEEYK